jgi:hypothetical protein
MLTNGVGLQPVHPQRGERCWYSSAFTVIIARSFQTLECCLFQDNVGDPAWMLGVTTCTTSTANLGRGYGRSH